MDVETYISDNITKLEEEKKGSMPFSDYLEKVSEKPVYGAHSAKYILEAIQSQGKKEVVEEGEVKERYAFFDDPFNNGKNAVLGNTDQLNSFVEDIRKISEGKGGTDKMLWVVGPTATGKSELKRCLINGINQYSKTEEGKRYTLAWKVGNSSSIGDIGFESKEKIYGDDGEWVKSPVQENPLKILYEEVREDFLEGLKQEKGEEIRLEGEVSPFDRKFLEEKGREGYKDIFNSMKELKVVEYHVERGKGIGVLQSEDEGSPKQRMVGKWKGDPTKIKMYGRGDPRVFEYSGVFSQGNNGLTVMEDVLQHQDVLQKLLNIPEEKQLEIGDSMKMDLDTVIMLISNPDLEYNLSKNEGMEEKDPFRALRRRMKKHRFRYLTNYSLETELLKREVSSCYKVWDIEDEEDMEEKVSEPMKMEVGDQEIELAPHALESAAMYNVLTRLEDDMEISKDVQGIGERSFNLIDKAKLFDKGYLKIGLKKLVKEDFEFSDKKDGKTGVPVTYTREKVLEKVEDEARNNGGKFGNTVMPEDLIKKVSDIGNLKESSISGKEAEKYSQLGRVVEKYVLRRQEEDVLDSLLSDLKPSEKEIVKYVESVADWYEELDTQEKVSENDKLFMKNFEIEELEVFGHGEYDSIEAGDRVEEFREKEIYDGIRKIAQEKKEDFVFSRDVPKIPVLKDRLVRNTWDTVFRNWDNFDPTKWENPPKDTDTEEVKEKAINNMVKEKGYTEKSAELASVKVLKDVADGFKTLDKNIGKKIT